MESICSPLPHFFPRLRECGAGAVLGLRVGFRTNTALAQEQEQGSRQELPGGNSALVPHLPIPNRTVKRRRADDSAV